MTRPFRGFKSVVENSPDAITVLNEEKVILYGSASSSSVLGYAPQELLGRSCLELIHPEDRDHANKALESALANAQGRVTWDSRVRHSNGKYSWFENTVANLLVDLEVQGIVMHQRDIDARRAAELERVQHAQDLGNCNARLEEFAYTAAHDLREPLRSIGAYTEMLLERPRWTASRAKWPALLRMVFPG